MLQRAKVVMSICVGVWSRVVLVADASNDDHVLAVLR